MLAVAALSARSLVDAAALDGLRTVALDVFGDADTLRASSQWLSIGEPAAVRIDAERLLQALHTLARRGDVQGWIAGSGFDGRPELLERGAALLPLIGTSPAELRRLRDPREFFAALDLHGIVHPPVRFEAPSSSDGWLTKDFAACGGWHVCRAAAGPTDVTGRHWQRERPGVPMSATFVANGRDAVLLGFNRQSVQAIGDRPFVFAGVIGPVPVDGAVRRAITRATRALAAAFGLRGLGSIDFLLDGDAAEVLEVNARAPASLSLYPRVGSGGPLRAHLRACREGELPAVPSTDAVVRGHTIVFACRPLQLDAAGAAMIAAWPEAHDLPHAGVRFETGHPVCSLSTRGHDAAQVAADLSERRAALLNTLESLS
jgi:uncharacterized protein